MMDSLEQQRAVQLNCAGVQDVVSIDSSTVSQLPRSDAPRQSYHCWHRHRGNLVHQGLFRVSVLELFCVNNICKLLTITRHFVNHVNVSEVFIRRAIKKFSAWPSSVQNKIKISFASYSSKAQNMTWLLRYKYFVHFSGRWLFAFDREKMELCLVTKRQFWPICSFHCMFCCSDSDVKLWMHVSSWIGITSCEINFCRVTSVSFENFFKNLYTVWC